MTVSVDVKNGYGYLYPNVDSLVVNELGNGAKIVTFSSIGYDVPSDLEEYMEIEERGTTVYTTSDVKTIKYDNSTDKWILVVG